MVSFASAVAAWRPRAESALVMSAVPIGITMRGSIDSIISRAFFLSRLLPSPIFTMRTSMLPMRSICSFVRVWPSSPRWQNETPSILKRKIIVRSPSLLPSSFFGLVKAGKPLIGISLVSYSPGQSKTRASVSMLRGWLVRMTCALLSLTWGSMATIALSALIVKDVLPCQVISINFD